VLNGLPLSAKVAALRSADAYGHRTGAIEAVETHFAWVFLTDRYAYKLKKPVRHDFLDLSTLMARHRNCNSEVKLNRRLAPDVYLGVVPLVQGREGRLHVGGGEAIVDWLVWMRRLPAAKMLDRAAAGGTIPPGSLRALGALLARFYARQTPALISSDAYVERIARELKADQVELKSPDLHLSMTQLTVATDAQLSAFAAVETELAERARQRRIVDSHGDLRPEHICLSDPPCVIDSLEFSASLRRLDAAEDLAFLTMECELAGWGAAADAVFAAYQAMSGDLASPQLLDFYRSRRAGVRAKVTAWHLRDPDYREREDWSSKADRYLEWMTLFARRACQR